MAKSRGFSIYLLKDTFLPENALKDDHNIQLLLEEGTNLPINTVMYIADTPGNALWWKNYWGIKRNLHQVQKRSLVFLQVDESNRFSIIAKNIK